MSTDIRELMLAGAHFGHRVRFSNPKMKPFIYGKYHSTHIINLDHTLEALARATDYLKSVAESNGKILYVCTKGAATEAIQEEAQTVGMPYVNKRWLGGILTNFKTTRNSVERLEKVEAEIADGALKNMTKKEGIKLLLTKDKLEKAIGGIREMTELPDALFIIDAGWHKGAVREANKLGIPVVAVVDTNHSPDDIDYVIPGNDDSREAIRIYLREATAAIATGKKTWEANLLAETQSAAMYADQAGAAAARQADQTAAMPPHQKLVQPNLHGKKSASAVVVEEKPQRPLPERRAAKPAKPAPSPSQGEQE